MTATTNMKGPRTIRRPAAGRPARVQMRAAQLCRPDPGPRTHKHVWANGRAATPPQGDPLLPRR
jgi:hypothetical protein